MCIPTTSVVVAHNLHMNFPAGHQCQAGKFLKFDMEHQRAALLLGRLCTYGKITFCFS